YEMPVPREACPFNLAPTTTTTALLALGDALALVLLEQRGFTKSDYGRRHPGGAIGRLVTMTAGDVMRDTEHIAVVSPERIVRETIYSMSHYRCGSAVIVGSKGELLGIFTDGDFRRGAEKDPDILKKLIGDIMTPSPVAVQKNMLVAEVLKILEKRRIDDIVVVDSENIVQGCIDVQDLPALKIM
ncbi:MAG: CBS domain-containing protein, partial [Lentisphaeria bacterium]|nr:CBS domain-containing protein [Lentisphaeria bacterium]